MQDQLAARCGSQRCRILEEPQPCHEGQQGFSMRENKLCRSFGDPLRALLQGPQQKVVQWADHLGVDRVPVGLFVKVLEVLQELESLHLLFRKQRADVRRPVVVCHLKTAQCVLHCFTLKSCRNYA